jgi:hypothetical protein
MSGCIGGSENGCEIVGEGGSQLLRGGGMGSIRIDKVRNPVFAVSFDNG